MYRAAHDAAATIGGTSPMASKIKKSKIVKKAGKKAEKKAEKKARKSDTEVDRSSIPPESPFSS
jgi:hypothetical protein